MTLNTESPASLKTEIYEATEIRERKKESKKEIS
jgi:hypothetical protein